jgi:hypothetical protein
MPFVYSTLTCDNIFPVYVENKDPHALPRIIHKIVIKGGHGVKLQKELHTPFGVRTQVSDSDLELLMKDLNFKKQISAGFITVDNKKVVAEKKAADMNPKDGSAPMTPKDFEKSDISEETLVYKEKGKK